MKWLTPCGLLVLACASCGRDADPATGPTPTVASEPKPKESGVSSEPQVTFESEAGPIVVQLEVVSSPAKIQRGLMHRRHLAPSRGMLFVFSSERVRSFWMKNTLIPLDMLFVKADMTVAGIERDTVPLSLESRTIGVPTQYVIEVNGGWTAKHGVEPGSKIKLANLPDVSGAPL